MMSDYEKGVAILQLVRSGDKDWISKVLRVRSGEPAPPQFVEIRSGSDQAEVISESEAARALGWSDAIWLSEQQKDDEDLIEAVERRGRSLAEAGKLLQDAEAEFRANLAKLHGAQVTEAHVANVLDKHSARLLEHEQLKSTVASFWREINRELLIAQSAAMRRAQGVNVSHASADRAAEEETRRREMEQMRAWIEREEQRHERKR